MHQSLRHRRRILVGTGGLVRHSANLLRIDAFGLNVFSVRRILGKPPARIGHRRVDQILQIRPDDICLKLVLLLREPGFPRHIRHIGRDILPWRRNLGDGFTKLGKNDEIKRQSPRKKQG